MKNNRLNFLKVFTFSFCLISAVMTSSVQSFEEDKEYRRTAAGSPIFLRFSNNVSVDNYGLRISRPGFNIYLFDEDPKSRTPLGYVTFSFDESRKVIEFSWVKIVEGQRGKGYAKEALRTAMGIFKSKQDQHPWATHYFLTVGDSVGPAMKKVAETLGFTVSSRFWHPDSMTDYEKPITMPKPDVAKS